MKHDDSWYAEKKQARNSAECAATRKKVEYGCDEKFILGYSLVMNISTLVDNRIK